MKKSKSKEEVLFSNHFLELSYDLEGLDIIAQQWEDCLQEQFLELAEIFEALAVFEPDSEKLITAVDNYDYTTESFYQAQTHLLNLREGFGCVLSIGFGKRSALANKEIFKRELVIPEAGYHHLAEIYNRGAELYLVYKIIECLKADNALLYAPYITFAGLTKQLHNLRGTYHRAAQLGFLERQEKSRRTKEIELLTDTLAVQSSAMKFQYDIQPHHHLKLDNPFKSTIEWKILGEEYPPLEPKGLKRLKPQRGL